MPGVRLAGDCGGAARPLASVRVDTLRIREMDPARSASRRRLSGTKSMTEAAAPTQPTERSRTTAADGPRSSWASSGTTATCSTSSPGGTSRSGTRRRVLGVAWAVLQPLLMMGIFTLVFSRIANVPTEGVPYPLFAFAGLVPWTMFSSAVGGSANSLLSDSNLVSKVYFPRLVIPAGAVVAWIPDFVFSSAVLFVLMAVYGFAPSVDDRPAPCGHRRDDRRRLQRRGMAVGTERRLSRCALRRAVPRAGVALRHAGGVPDELDSGGSLAGWPVSTR